MACRALNWKIVEAIIDTYPNVNINHKDSNGWNALHLAINGLKGNICIKMIEMIDKRQLRSEVNAENKTALMMVTEMVDDDIMNADFIPEDLERKILTKTGQKENPYRKPKQNTPVDKSQVQSLRLFRGRSCGFLFECLESSVWTCMGQNCNVSVELGEDFILEDDHHYSRYTKMKAFAII